MRIVYVTAKLPFTRGETFISEEIRELIGRGHEVLVTPRSPENCRPQPDWMAGCALRESLYSRAVARKALGAAGWIPAALRTGAVPGRIFAAAKNWAVAPKAIWLAKVAREWRADHIHCHWAGTTATMAMIASRLSGIPWSLTAHRWDIVENNALTAKAHSASFVRVISEGSRQLIEERGVSSNVLVLRMGVRLPDRANWRAPEKARVVCPANLVEVKGHRQLLKAWRVLQDRGVRAELWIAGDGELSATLQRLRDDLGIGDSVRFLGRVDHDALLSWYGDGSVSAVALSSVDLGGGHHEGLPVALIEAMGHAIPVVATRTGSIPELLADGAGVLVAPNDPAGLALALERILADRGLAQQLGSAGRRRASQAHDIRHVAAELEKLFSAAADRLPTGALSAC